MDAFVRRYIHENLLLPLRDDAGWSSGLHS